VDLPAVGLNLQEQTLSAMGAKGTNFNLGGSGPSDVIAYPNIYQVCTYRIHHVWGCGGLICVETNQRMHITARHAKNEIVVWLWSNFDCEPHQVVHSCMGSVPGEIGFICECSPEDIQHSSWAHYQQ